MLKKWNVTIPSLSGDHPRKTYIWLPDSYEEDPEKRYPVLYMFDGHNIFRDEYAAFGKSWGMEAYMEQTGKELIIVAVECNHEGNHRLMEYSPVSYRNKKHGSIPGKAPGRPPDRRWSRRRGARGRRRWRRPTRVRAQRRCGRRPSSSR